MKIKLWKEMSKEEKRKVIITNIILLILFSVVVVAFVFYDKFHGEGSFFDQSFEQVPAFVNHLFHAIPKVIDTVSAIIIAIVTEKIVCWIIKKANKKNNRGVTIAQMIQSFVKWITAIALVLIILSIWGVDTATLLASAGVLTLVIGLGAQSLVADIVAGIFIVFEGEYQVGDIVVFQGFRGTVKEVGIRTTKIEDAGGDVKIVNNSEIRQIINQTKELSLAKCTLNIEYRESLERVEAIINDNLEKIGKKIPGIIQGPYYKGVSELNDNGVTLFIIATCKEDDIFQVQRDLNREFKILCEKENIGLAFPQVTVHQANETPTVANKEMQEKAEKIAYSNINVDLSVNDKDVDNSDI